jgi:hypothetical protein
MSAPLGEITRWDRNLSVAPDAEGLIGHAGAVLHRHPPGTYEPDTTAENRHNTISN